MKTRLLKSDGSTETTVRIALGQKRHNDTVYIDMWINEVLSADKFGPNFAHLRLTAEDARTLGTELIEMSNTDETLSMAKISTVRKGYRQK